MITALQIALLLVLIALIGIILGYLFGRLACKKKESSVYFDKNDYCEGQYQQNVVKNYSDDDINSLHDTTDTEINNDAESGESIDVVQSDTEVTISDDRKPVVLSAPKGEKDNLMRIKGIGSKIEQTLNDTGVYHFEQIATWSEQEIAWIDQNLAFSGRIVRENWIEQAKLLSKGEDTEFSKRVDEGKVATSKKD